MLISYQIGVCLSKGKRLIAYTLQWYRHKGGLEYSSLYHREEIKKTGICCLQRTLYIHKVKLF